MAQQGNVIRANTVPPGGPAAVHAIGAAGTGMLLPDTLQIQEMADIFFENSEQNYLQLNTVPVVPGQQSQFILQNVGLGESLELYVSGSFNLRNNHATLARVLTIAPEFPFNIISNVQMMFNGKVALINASAYDLFRMMLKRNYKNSGMLRTFNSGRSPVGEYMRVDKRIANFNVSAGTLTEGEALCGFTSLSIPAVTTVTVSFEFYLDISFVLRKDLPFGLVPMQHNAIYANMNLTAAALVAANHENPFHIAAGELANIEISAVNMNAEPVYNFWGLPNNPELYSFFVNNSYVLTAHPRNAITSAGARGLTFNFPLNYWLISAMFTPRENGGRLARIRDNINFPTLVYNGTIHVDRSPIRHRIAREITHTGRAYPFGTLMFDGAQTNNLDGNSINMSRWLNMYQANNPQYFADIVGTFALPGTFDVLLEQLIPNYVTVL